MKKFTVCEIALNAVCLFVIFVWGLQKWDSSAVSFLPLGLSDLILKFGILVGVLLIVLVYIPSWGKMISAATNYFFTRFGDPEITAEVKAAKDHTEEW
jgi:hypothetical protein